MFFSGRLGPGVPSSSSSSMMRIALRSSSRPPYYSLPPPLLFSLGCYMPSFHFSFPRLFSSTLSSSSGEKKRPEKLQKALLARTNETIEKYKDLQERLKEADLPPAERGLLSKEVGELYRVTQLGQQLKEKTEEAEDLKNMAAKGIDAELLRLAEDEYVECTNSIFDIETELIHELLPKDSAENASAILEVRGGAGGSEAQIFALDIFQMYRNYAALKGWEFELVSMQESGDVPGVREATATISGRGVFGALKFESGVHRVQRIPQTETQGRTHTSTMTVAILPVPDATEVQIKPADLRIDTYRSRGAGGQHVNTTDSAVRITHLPTGTVVAIQDERSQHKNKDKAMKLLRARLYEAERSAKHATRDTERRRQIGTGERHERIRTYNYPQGRITDHRVPITVMGIDAMMEGELLDQIVDALVQAEQSQMITDLMHV